jgi:hypothetical protein
MLSSALQCSPVLSVEGGVGSWPRSHDIMGYDSTSTTSMEMKLSIASS